MPEGFTRITYENGFKCIMIYPPGWKNGDPRQPALRREPWAPAQAARALESDVFERWRPNPTDLDPDPDPLPTRQPRVTAIRTRRLARPGTGAQPQGFEGAEHWTWSHPLRTYLAQAWMPRYTLGYVDASVRYEWPFLRVLVRPRGTRQLYLAQRILDWDLRCAVDAMRPEFGDTRIGATNAKQGQLADLTLPDTSCCTLDTLDARFIDGCRVTVPADITRLVQEYPLRTVICAVKLFLKIPEEHPACKSLRFNEVNHLCPVRNAGLFDLIALPGYDLHGPRDDWISMLIVCAAPWDIKFDDLKDFVRTGVPDWDVDLTTPGPPHPADILWAVIWDMCQKYHCRYFVLTTYDQWVFGALSDDMHRVHMTTHLRAPVFSPEMAVSLTDVAQTRLPVPNVFEVLVLWILAAADGRHVWWPLPKDLPAPVDPRELCAVAGSRGLDLDQFVSR